MVLVAVAAAGCAGSPGRPSVDPMATGSTQELSIKEMAAASNAWREKPDSVRRAIVYVKHLEMAGQTQEKLTVLETTLRYNQDDAKLTAWYGKELAIAGRSMEAERVLRKAIALGEADSRVYSALGSALDQLTKHEPARQAYATALKMDPGNFGIRNNIGMSYMLQGDLKSAEATLRDAVALPGGDQNQTIRQNLALSVGLQGRFDEARDIASRDLPADVVEANMAYLQQMLNQRDTWQQLKQAS